MTKKSDAQIAAEEGVQEQLDAHQKEWQDFLKGPLSPMEEFNNDVEVRVCPQCMSALFEDEECECLCQCGEAVYSVSEALVEAIRNRYLNEPPPIGQGILAQRLGPLGDRKYYEVPVEVVTRDTRVGRLAVLARTPEEAKELVDKSYPQWEEEALSMCRDITTETVSVTFKEPVESKDGGFELGTVVVTEVGVGDMRDMVGLIHE